MSRSSSPISEKVNVRSIISIFENQSYTVNDEPTILVRRTKSMGSLVQRPQVTKRVIEHQVSLVEPEKVDKNLELVQIEQQIQHLQRNVQNNYKSYSRENHIYYQNQIIFILTDLANVETRNNAHSIHKKSELAEDLKRLNKKLNGLLPAAGQNVYTPTATVVSKNEKVPVTPKAVEEKRKAPKKEEPQWRVERTRIKEQRSFDEQQRVEEQQRIEELKEREEEHKEEEEEEVQISVKSLKQKFEANSNESEAKREFGQTKLSRKFMTFNGTSDTKYITYSEKYKNNVDAEFTKRKSSVTFDEAVDNSFSHQQVTSFDNEDKDENVSESNSHSESDTDDEDSGDDQSQSDRDVAKEQKE